MAGRGRLYRPRTIPELAHMWLAGELGEPRGVPRAEVPVFHEWFRSHMQFLPNFAQVFLKRVEMTVCYALTTGEGPIVNSLLAYLEDSRAKDPAFASTLAVPVGYSGHMSILLYGLLVREGKNWKMLVCMPNWGGVMGLVPLSKAGALDTFVVAQSDGTLFISDDALFAPGFVRSEGKRIYWPASVVEAVHKRAQNRAAAAKKIRDADVLGSEDDEGEQDEDEGESEDDAVDGGPKRARTAGGGSRRYRGVPGVPGAPREQAANPAGGGAPPAEQTDFQRAVAAYRNLTPELQQAFRTQNKLVSLHTFSQLSVLSRAVNYDELLTAQMTDIRENLVGVAVSPFLDINHPPDWIMAKRAEKRVPLLLDRYEVLLIETLCDAWLYWNFFRRVLHYIKYHDPFDSRGRLKKSVDRPRVIFELLNDMPFLFFLKTFGASYVLSGGLFYVMSEKFVPFEETAYFNGKSIPEDIKTCYTDALASLQAQRWPLSLARHLAFRKVSRLPVFAQQAADFVKRPKYCNARMAYQLEQALYQHLLAESVRTHKPMRAFKAIRGLYMFYHVPSPAPMDPFSTEDEAGAVERA